LIYAHSFDTISNRYPLPVYKLCVTTHDSGDQNPLKHTAVREDMPSLRLWYGGISPCATLNIETFLTYLRKIAGIFFFPHDFHEYNPSAKDQFIIWVLECLWDYYFKLLE